MNQWESAIAASFAVDIKEYSDELLECLHFALAMEDKTRAEAARIIFEKALKENS